MASELVIDYATGSTIYALLMNVTGGVWNGTTFETPAAANWATYDIACTESGTTGLYLGDMPSISAGLYSALFRLQAGAAPATTDTPIGDTSLQWSGTAITTTAASTSRYATASVLKSRLDIDDALDDTNLASVLDAVSRGIDNYTGRRFYVDSSDATRYYTAEYSDILFCPDDVCTLTTLSTDGDGDRTYEDDWAATDYDLLPLNASADSAPYTMIGRTPNGDYTFPVGVVKGIKIVGTFGWGSTVPDPIGEACLLLAERLFKRKDAPFGIMGSGGLGTVRMVQKAIEDDLELALLLQPYRRIIG